MDALLAEAHAHAVLDREVIEVERIAGYTPPLSSCPFTCPASRVSTVG